MKLNTYINFGGNCAEAFRFYEKHLGGKITFMMTFGDNPDAAKAHPDAKDLILHAAMQIGGTVLMASDAVGEKYQPMRSAYLSLGVDSSEEAERVHAALADGGEIFMPMAETFFAHRFSMLRDKFGVNWMVIHQRPAPGA
jgi:PhnB protein